MPRLSSAKWSEEDSQRFMRSLRANGKNWRQIAADVGTKNEQQCRTRGLILFNKLQKHCWDDELYNILKPHQGQIFRNNQGKLDVVKDETPEEAQKRREAKKKAKAARRRARLKAKANGKVFDFNALKMDTNNAGEELIQPQPDFQDTYGEEMEEEEELLLSPEEWEAERKLRQQRRYENVDLKQPFIFKIHN